MVFEEFDDGFGRESGSGSEAPFDSGHEHGHVAFPARDVAPREPHRAMILDDNPVTAAQLGKLAERLFPGWALEQFTTLPEAMQALARSRFAAVLTDFNLQDGRTSEPLVNGALSLGVPSSHIAVWTGNPGEAREAMPASVSVHQKPNVNALKKTLTTIRQMVEGFIGEA